MKAAEFEYHAPTTIAEAVALYAEHGYDAKLLAGGQSLVPILALRLSRFGHLIDLNHVAEMAYISTGENAIAVGAMTRQSTAEHSADVARHAPLVAKAIPNIGHFQIRNRGTVGGSIAHADPASELPAVVRTLGAEMEVHSTRGARRIAASDFFTSVWETAIASDEILTGVHFPDWGPHSGFSLEEMATRRGDFAIVGVACGVRLSSSGTIDRAGITFMGMGPTPMAASSAEESLLGKAPSDLDLAAVSELAVEATSPTDDVHANADYRTHVAQVLVRRALASAFEEAAHA